ncbi:hypothetical protein ACTUVN_002787 [Pseudomonas caspiana]
MNSQQYVAEDVGKLATRLISKARAISLAHLEPGIPRVRFQQQVARYTKGIVRKVEQGLTPAAQAVRVLQQERADLLAQSRALKRDPQSAIPSAVKRIQCMWLLQPSYRRDPERLLRFVHEQHLRALEHKARKPGKPLRPKPADLFDFFPQEQWPEPVELHEPGFYIVPKSTTAAQLQADLFTSPSRAVLDKFMALNPGLGEVVRAGQLIVLSDPENPRCTLEETLLMSTAQNVKSVLDEMSPEEAEFMVRHRDEIESFLTHGSSAIGVGESVFARHLSNVNQLMVDIEKLHTDTLKQFGHLRAPEFFEQRKNLFSLLDSQLNSLTKKGIGFPDHPKLKTALGISSRSLVHRYGRAGATGQNPGYYTQLGRVAKASQYIKYGGWLGPVVGGGASYMKVQEVCRAGDSDACEKVKFAETGALSGSVAGGMAAGYLSGPVIAVCASSAVATAGVGPLTCGIVLIGAGAYGGGYAGGKIGEYIGEVIYEVKNAF